MKHVLLLLTLGILCPFLLPSQNTIFAPEGAVWRYNMYTDDAPYGARQYRYVAAKDTLIYGKNARIIQGEIWTDGAFVPAPEMTRFTYTEGDKVYHSVDNGFVVLYDFGAQPGDTIYSAVSGGPYSFYNQCAQPPQTRLDFLYIIDAVGTIETDGQLLRTQTVHTPSEFGFAEWSILGLPGTWQDTTNVKIIERVGGKPAPNWFGGGEFCLTSGYHALLRCYTDNSISVEGITENLPCDSVVATHAPLLPGFSIGPNPFTADLKLVVPAHSYPDLQFTLYHYSGQEISHSSLRQGENILHTGPLPAGIYFWEIRSDARLLGSGKLVR